MGEHDVIAALAAFGDDVDRLVEGLGPDAWSTPTPAEGWSIAHQVAHLAATFRLAGLAAADPEAFKALAANLGPDFNANVAAAMADYLAEPPDRLYARWRDQRQATGKALAAVPAGQAVPWLVRPLPAPVLAMAGMSEAFAHGQDIADALGVERTHTDRIRHVAEFAVLTWDFGYLSRGLTPPESGFGFTLTAPSGAVWELGSPDAAQRISGPAVDFCLLATRRRHRDDLALTAAGADADRWLDVAQAYRGPAGSGRSPGQFTPVSTPVAATPS